MLNSGLHSRRKPWLPRNGLCKRLLVLRSSLWQDCTSKDRLVLDKLLPPDSVLLLPNRSRLELLPLPVNEIKMPIIRRLPQLRELPLLPDSELLLQRELPSLDRDNRSNWQQREQLLLRGLLPKREGHR